VRRVVLLRHGRTEWNAQRRFQGQADPPLDDVGRAQAWAVAALVAALRPEVLISSDLIRAMQTATVVGELVDRAPVPEPRFRERGLGHWEGLTRDEVEVRYPDEFADWLGGGDVSRRGGETREEVAERALAAFGELPAVPTTVLVTHSATAMALTNALLGIAQAIHPLGPLANCHWSELYAEPVVGGSAAWRLRGHNLGVPGTVVPLPVRLDADDASDADGDRRHSRLSAHPSPERAYSGPQVPPRPAATDGGRGACTLFPRNRPGAVFWKRDVRTTASYRAALSQQSRCQRGRASASGRGSSFARRRPTSV
jgi:glucosyl-3-phosphoglycerate phosphatase